MENTTISLSEKPLSKICNLADLHYFIKSDQIANKFDGSTKHRIMQLLNPNPILSYLRALRKAEYYTNVGGLLRFPIRMYWCWKKKCIGLKLGFSIPNNTCGPGLSLPHYGTIIINPNARIGKNCRIHACVNIGASGGGKNAPIIGDNVYIGPSTVIFGGIQIGSNNSIGANATVNKSFTQEHVVIAGTPAKVMKESVQNWLEFNHVNQRNDIR